jgi:hypothetical protein
MMKKLLVALTAVVLAAAVEPAGSHDAPAPQQPPGWRHIHGHVNTVDGTKLKLHADDGRLFDVDMSDVMPAVRRALARNERVTVVGFPGAKGNDFRARFIQQDDPGRASARADETAWQRIHGTVQAVHGTTVAVKADDGRVLTVDTADARKGVGRALTPGERVEVIGQVHRDRNHVTARWIEQDNANRLRGGRATAQPSASPRLDQKDLQRVQGTVQSLRGSTLTLEADDGRVLNVDVKGLSPTVLRALTPGEAVTVIGHAKRDGAPFSAHVIEHGRSGRVARSQSP